MGGHFRLSPTSSTDFFQGTPRLSPHYLRPYRLPAHYTEGREYDGMEMQPVADQAVTTVYGGHTRSKKHPGICLLDSNQIQSVALA